MPAPLSERFWPWLFSPNVTPLKFEPPSMVVMIWRSTSINEVFRISCASALFLALYCECTVRYGMNSTLLVGRRVLFFRRLQDSIDSSDSFLRYVRRYKEGKGRRRGLMTPRATKHYKQLEKGLCTSNRRVCSFKIVCTVCRNYCTYS